MKDLSVTTHFKERDFWCGLFSSGFVRTQIPVSNPSAERDMRTVHFSFSSSDSQQVLQVAGGSDVKLFILMQSALLLVMKAYSQSTSISYGVPIYKQQATNLINTFLPLRIELDESDSFRKLLQKSSQLLFQANENQNYRMEALLYNLDITNHEMEDYPLFDVVVMSDALHNRSYIEHLKVNLIFDFHRTEEAISCLVKFNASRYAEAFVNMLLNNYQHALKQCISNLDAEIGRVDIVSHYDRELLVERWNNTKVQDPADGNIFQAFQRSVDKNRDRIAMVFFESQFTYGYVNSLTNQIARYFKRQGISQGEIVPLIMDKSPEMILSILAIMKCGAAYLPIDINLPSLRRKTLLRECGASFVVGTTGLEDDIGIKCIDFRDGSYREEDAADLDPAGISPSQPLYILFTSGSTGVPKGIVVEHRNVLNLINWFGRTFEMDRDKRVLQFSDYTFDTSVEDIFGALLYGATLILPTKNLILDQSEFRYYMDRNQVNHLSTVPSFLETISSIDAIKSLKCIISGGEALKDSLKDRLLDIGYTVYNTYGPSETTVEVLFKKCGRGPVNLGKPVDNTRCYIVDERGRLNPVGVVGEIRLAGACVTRGYLNNPELTHDKFTLNIFEREGNLYCTGDFGRWVPDGTIDFVGRNDEQVKIRGHRIELQEIQRTMLKVPDVTDAIILLKNKETTPELYCYFISDRPIPRTVIIHFLADRLPRYMIPTFFKRVAEFPKLANGKINKNAFDQSQYQVEDEEKVIVAPSDEIEEKLVTIWKQVLGLRDLSIFDNFFEIGGDSLKIVQLQNILKSTFQSHITVLTLFKYPTIHALGEYIKASTNAEPEDPTVRTTLEKAAESKNRQIRRLQRSSSI